MNLTEINERCSCARHFPRFDPDCRYCSMMLQWRKDDEKIHQESTQQAVVDSGDSDEWPESLVNKAIGGNPDGSFTMCPEVYSQFVTLMKWSGWIRLNGSHRDELEKLKKLLYRHQGMGYEEYT